MKNMQQIEALNIEIGDQIEIVLGNGGSMWRRVTGHFLDGSGLVNIELNHSRIIKRRRNEKITIVRPPST